MLDPLHHTIIATDVVASGSRTDPLLIRMRADLRTLLDETLSRQNINLAQLATKDLGDGYRVLLPAAISPRAALDPFVSNLATRLRLHNQASSIANRLRLRVALHTGLVHPEPSGGWTGVVLKESARLLEAPAGRAILEAAPAADLVVLVSAPLHDAVVRHGYSIDPALFRRIRVRVKETDEYAWAHLPGLGRAPNDPDDAPPDPDCTPPERADNRSAAQLPRSSGVTIIGDGHVFRDAIAGRDVHRPAPGSRW